MSIQRAQKDRTQPRGGLREARRRFTAQHIREAAIEVFLARGYVASTVEDIIEQAGTSRRTFYAHFNSKAHVLVEIANTLLPEIEENYRRLDQAIDARSPEVLHEFMEWIIDWCARYGGLMPIWQQAEAVEPEFEAQRQELVQKFPELMPQYFARWPRAHREEPRLRIVLFSVQLDRFWTYSPPREMSPAERALLASTLTNMWHSALQAPPLPRSNRLPAS